MDDILRRILALDEPSGKFDDRVKGVMRDLLVGLSNSVWHAARRIPGKPPLHRAVFAGDIVALRRLLLSASGKVDVNEAGDTVNPFTPLQFAACLGHTECVRLLLGAGADPNACLTPNEQPPLFLAALDGHAMAVALLLDAGADRDGPDNEATPLTQAATEGHIDCVRLLLRAGARVWFSVEALHRALSLAPLATMSTASSRCLSALTK
jgi:hypothetical protein